jgi:DNA repair ATPase RecN
LCEAREEKIVKDIRDAEAQRDELANDIEEIRRHKADLLEPQLIASTKELKVCI